VVELRPMLSIARSLYRKAFDLEALVSSTCEFCSVFNEDINLDRWQNCL
jgi:hypothetical protein